MAEANFFAKMYLQFFDTFFLNIINIKILQLSTIASEQLRVIKILLELVIKLQGTILKYSINRKINL